MTGFTRVVERERILVVYPEGPAGALTGSVGAQLHYSPHTSRLAAQRASRR
jgi:poly(3-hydroxybutyrate) depolymerase